MRLSLFLGSKSVFFILLSALLSGCASIPQKTPTTMNYAYLTERPQPGNRANAPDVFKPSYGITITAIDDVPKPTGFGLLKTYLISPGQHSITILCSVTTMADDVFDQGIPANYIRTLTLTAKPNGNYAVEYNLPSGSAFVVYKNACNYAVIRAVDSIK